MPKRLEANKTKEELGIPIGAKLVLAEDYDDLEEGDIVVLESTYQDLAYVKRLSDNEKTSLLFKRMYLYEEDNSIEISIPFISNIMTNALEFFRNLTLSSDDKLLMEMGLENPTGVPTEEALKLSAEMMYKKQRTDIVALAQQMKEAKEAASKK